VELKMKVEKILNLVFKYSYGEESYGLVYENDNKFDVYEIPQYGGIERYHCSFSDFNSAVEYAKTFT
jgi:hypothetical protein